MSVCFIAFLVISLAQGLEVRIESSENTAPIVDITLTNKFSEAAVLCVWNSPFDVASDIFRADMFTAVGPSGEKPEYIGILAKRRPILSDFITLQSLQSVKVSLDLSKGYWFPVAGKYKVSLDTFVQIYLGELDFEMVLENGLSDFKFENLTSDSIIVQVTNLLPAPVWGSPSNGSLGGPAPKSNCASNQASQINTAGANAITATRQGGTYLPASCSSSLTYYTRWFGVCDATRFSKVKSDLSKILTALQGTYPVDCAGSSCTANTYAYVFPNDAARNIYVCAYYFRVPTGNCVMDSQPGTLIHEMSHFSTVAATGDYKYGIVNCENLAKTTPAEAVRNADNFCFYTDSCPR